MAQLIHDLRSAAELVGGEPVGMVPVAKAAEKAKIRVVELLHLILGAHLARVTRVDGEDGIAALRGDPDEVKQGAGALITDLSALVAFGALRIPIRSGWALIDGIADVQLPHRRLISADGRHAFIRIRAEDVADFAYRFTTIVRIADATGRQGGAGSPGVRDSRASSRSRASRAVAASRRTAFRMSCRPSPSTGDRSAFEGALKAI